LVVISLDPDDGDGLTGNGRQAAGRQRNEISVRHPSCRAHRNERVTYKVHLETPKKIDWSVDGQALYNMIYGKRRPLFTIGVKKSQLAIYNCDKETLTWTLTLARSCTRKFRDKSNGDDSSGGDDRGDKRYTYFKVGQYRSCVIALHQLRKHN
jgi:hypothetical protein